MKFFIPVKSPFPDARYNSLAAAKEASTYMQLEHTGTVSAEQAHMIRTMFASFFADYTNAGKTELLAEYFCAGDTLAVVDVDGRRVQGRQPVKELLELQGNRWSVLDMDVNNMIVSMEDDVAWVLAQGYAINKQKEGQVLAALQDNIRKIMEEDIQAKKKLFKIQRDISLMLKESAEGQEYIWPLRFEGILARENGWKLQSMQFSYPFVYILEDKVDI